MDREEVIRMAKEAGAGAGKFHPSDNEETIFPNPMDVFRFASLVAAAERERCAKVCADHPGHIPSNKWNASSALGSCEEAIRALP